MFYLVGLGLGDAKDISVKGLEIVKSAERVYLESYTSVLTGGKEALEEFYGRSVIIAEREMIEQDSQEILDGTDCKDVVLLVVGDPFGATTHTDLALRAKQMNIPVNVIHNASILNAIGCCGLQLYHFGETISIPYWTESWKPESFYDKIIGNRDRGLHTLCLLDIKVREPTFATLTKKVKEYMPSQFMSVSEAAEQLLQITANRSKKEENTTVLPEDCLCVGVARVGSATQKIVACSLKEMKDTDLGPPLHSLVVCGKLHPLEREYLFQFAINPEMLKTMI